MSEVSASANEILTPELDRRLEKYDRPGPRYTSYPTAPAWNFLKPSTAKGSRHRWWLLPARETS